MEMEGEDLSCLNMMTKDEAEEEQFVSDYDSKDEDEGASHSESVDETEALINRSQPAKGRWQEMTLRLQETGFL